MVRRMGTSRTSAGSSTRRVAIGLAAALTLSLGASSAVAQTTDPTTTAPAAAPAPAPVGVAAVRALFDGIPQDGMALGRRSARATLWQAEDPQCPVCREYSETAFPRIVRRDVRTGRARVRLVLFPFIGDDSDRAAQFVVAAGRQDRAFQALQLLYRNQGDENSGYVTDAFLQGLATAVGLDVPRVMADMRTPAVAAEVRRQAAFAEAHGSTGTPTLWTQRPGDRLRQFRNFTDARGISARLAQR